MPHLTANTMDIYRREAIHGRLQEEGYNALYNPHTNGLQLGIPSVSY